MNIDRHELKSWLGALLCFAIATPCVALGILNVTPKTTLGWGVLILSGFAFGMLVWLFSFPINWLERRIHSRHLCVALRSVLIVAFGAAIFGVILYFYPFLSGNFYLRRF